jgi:hypothetical protein
MRIQYLREDCRKWNDKCLSVFNKAGEKTEMLVAEDSFPNRKTEAVIKIPSDSQECGGLEHVLKV